MIQKRLFSRSKLVISGECILPLLISSAPVPLSLRMNHKVRVWFVPADEELALLKQFQQKFGPSQVTSKRPDQLAKIIDGHTVEFQGQRVLINEWARKMAGWPSINIYDNIYLERTKQPLGKLRE